MSIFGVSIFLSVLMLYADELMQGDFLNGLLSASLSVFSGVLILLLFIRLQEKKPLKWLIRAIIISAWIVFHTLIFYYVVLHKEDMGQQETIISILISLLQSLIVFFIVLMVFRQKKGKTTG